IKMHQARDYPGRGFGTALDNPDFEAIAGAYGFGYHRIESVADFIAGFDAGLDAGGVNGQVFELILDKRDISPNKILEG
nr:thiamine pyrophosphate-binding protein [Pseudomonadota bacterium]